MIAIYAQNIYIKIMHQPIDLFASLSGTAPLQNSVNTTLDYLPLLSRLPDLQNLLPCKQAAVSRLSVHNRAILTLVSLYNMRVSELLSLTIGSMIKPSVFLVQALKHSFAYTVMIPLSPEETESLLVRGRDTKLFPYTYHSLWLAMKRTGLSWSVEFRANQIVTHKSRYDLAAKLSLLDRMNDIQGCLHHRSPASTDYYVRSGGLRYSNIERFRQSKDSFCAPIPKPTE